MKIVLTVVFICVIIMGLGILFANMGGLVWGTPAFAAFVMQTIPICVLVIVAGCIVALYTYLT